MTMNMDSPNADLKTSPLGDSNKTSSALCRTPYSRGLLSSNSQNKIRDSLTASSEPGKFVKRTAEQKSSSLSLRRLSTESSGSNNNNNDRQQPRVTFVESQNQFYESNFESQEEVSAQWCTPEDIAGYRAAIVEAAKYIVNLKIESSSSSPLLPCSSLEEAKSEEVQEDLPKKVLRRTYETCCECTMQGQGGVGIVIKKEEQMEMNSIYDKYWEYVVGMERILVPQAKRDKATIREQFVEQYRVLRLQYTDSAKKLAKEAAKTSEEMSRPARLFALRLAMAQDADLVAKQAALAGTSSTHKVLGTLSSSSSRPSSMKRLSSLSSSDEKKTSKSNRSSSNERQSQPESSEQRRSTSAPRDKPAGDAIATVARPSSRERPVRPKSREQPRSNSAPRDKQAGNATATTARPSSREQPKPRRSNSAPRDKQAGNATATTARPSSREQPVQPKPREQRRSNSAPRDKQAGNATATTARPSSRERPNKKRFDSPGKSSSSSSHSGSPVKPTRLSVSCDSPLKTEKYRLSDFSAKSLSSSQGRGEQQAEEKKSQQVNRAASAHVVNISASSSSSNASSHEGSMQEKKLPSRSTSVRTAIPSIGGDENNGNTSNSKGNGNKPALPCSLPIVCPSSEHNKPSRTLSREKVLPVQPSASARMVAQLSSRGTVKTNGNSNKSTSRTPSSSIRVVVGPSEANNNGTSGSAHLPRSVHSTRSSSLSEEQPSRRPARSTLSLPRDASVLASPTPTATSLSSSGSKPKLTPLRPASARLAA